MKKTSILCVFLFLLYSINFFHKVTIAADYGVHEGEQALPFELQDENGTNVKLQDFYGKKVIVNFFATWCPPCQEEMPLLVHLHEQLDTNKEVLIGVNLTKEERNRRDVELFMKQFGASYLVLYDEEGKVMDDYQIFGIPVTVFINEEGKITKRINGELTKEIVDEFLK